MDLEQKKQLVDAVNATGENTVSYVLVEAKSDGSTNICLHGQNPMLSYLHAALGDLLTDLRRHNSPTRAANQNQPKVN